jgi:hypothetical protein
MDKKSVIEEGIDTADFTERCGFKNDFIIENGQTASAVHKNTIN